MKKIIYLGIIFFCVIVVFSCGGNKEQKKPNKVSDTIQTENLTVLNLKQALFMETTNVKKFEAYAQRARDEKLLTIATLFMAASKSAEIHAKNHQLVLKELDLTEESIKDNFEVKSTEENIASAIAEEMKAVDELYPEYTEQASNDKNTKAAKSFGWAHESEMKFMEYFQQALEHLKNKKQNILPRTYLVCPKCGYTYIEKDVKENCELCGTTKEKFIIINN